jgi:hypothetical protein
MNWARILAVQPDERWMQQIARNAGYRYSSRGGPVQCRERLGELVRYYDREAA